jgi:uncharacterized membrane protein YqjE
MLLDTLKILGSTLAEIVRTRLEILSLDVEEAQIRLVSWVVLFLFSFFFVTSAVILGVIFVLTAFWESQRLLALGILTGTFFLLGFLLLCILYWKVNHSPSLLSGFLREQEKDFDLFGLSKGSPHDQS